MSGVYKEKKCPNCNILHRKRGNYCGQSCANESRIITEATKEKMARSNAEYLMTPEGVANSRRASFRLSSRHAGAPPPVTVEDFLVDIPDTTDLSDYDLDGYDHASNW